MEGQHLISAFMATLVVVFIAFLAFRRWQEIIGEDLPTGWEMVAALFILIVYLRLIWRVWGTAWGYPVLLLPTAVFLAYEPVRRCFQKRYQTYWVEQDLDRCRKLLEFDPKNHGAYEEMARLYESAGDNERAIESIEKALKLAPLDQSYRYLHQRLLEKRQKLYRICPHCGEEVRRELRRCPTCRQRALKTED